MSMNYGMIALYLCYVRVVFNFTRLCSLIMLICAVSCISFCQLNALHGYRELVTA
uniref:Uncharacterized protein n=1 Tax=Arundo donax TaxID=35708 RepID=A0A0A9NKW4_ARUDO